MECLFYEVFVTERNDFYITDLFTKVVRETADIIVKNEPNLTLSSCIYKI